MDKSFVYEWQEGEDVVAEEEDEPTTEGGEG